MKPVFKSFSPDSSSIWHPDRYHEDIKEHILWPVKLFTGSFVAGTALLILFRLTNSEMLLVAGFWYVVIAFFLNAFAFICLIIVAALNYRHGLPILLRALLLLVNIPVSILYLNIVFEGDL